MKFFGTIWGECHARKCFDNVDGSNTFGLSRHLFRGLCHLLRLVVLRLLHGLVYLPVLLSYVGPINAADDIVKVQEIDSEGTSETTEEEVVPPFSPHTYCTLCQGVCT